MQEWRSLNWLPQISSLGGMFPSGFIKRIAILCLGLSSTFFSPLIFGTVLAQTASTRVYLYGIGNQPSILGIVGGKAMPATVRVSNVTNSTGLAAFSFKISYNPNLVSIADADNDYVADAGVVSVGPFLGSTGKQVRCSDGYIDIDLADSTKRYLTFTCGTLGALPAAPTGSGILATINFQSGNTVGLVPIGLDVAQLADNSASANLIANTRYSGTGIVVKCADVVGNDHKVTVADILYVVSKYHTTDAAADLDNSGVVVVSDILIAVAEFGATC